MGNTLSPKEVQNSRRPEVGNYRPSNLGRLARTRCPSAGGGRAGASAGNPANDPGRRRKAFTRCSSTLYVPKSEQSWGRTTRAYRHSSDQRTQYSPFEFVVCQPLTRNWSDSHCTSPTASCGPPRRTGEGSADNARERAEAAEEEPTGDGERGEGDTDISRVSNLVLLVASSTQSHATIRL